MAPPIELPERTQLDRIEAKLDQVIEFTETAKGALENFMTGPGAKMMAVMSRAMGGGK